MQGDITKLESTELRAERNEGLNVNMESLMSQSIPTGYIPPGQPPGFTQKNCPEGWDLTFESCSGAGNSTRAGILWKVQTMLNAI